MPKGQWPAPPANLATEKTVFGNSVHEAATPLSKAIDQKYGNAFARIAHATTPTDPFIGVDLGGLFELDQLAFGRSNVSGGDPCSVDTPGVCTDRNLGLYTLQYTQVANPDRKLVTTVNATTGWATIGTLDYQSAGGTNFSSPHLRHLYGFKPVNARGLRLLVPPATAIDEMEIFAGRPAYIASVRKIWDRAPHNAFTDLIRFKDRGYFAFREGQGHVSPEGALRVITSVDGKTWESAALFTSEDSDLRDAKLTITPDGRLMLSGAEAMNGAVGYKHQSLTWFSRDGRQWDQQNEVGDRGVWLWRTTWHKGKAYGFGYGTRADNRGLRLYTSDDGKSYDTLIANAFSEGYPNEASMVFRDDGTCYCLLRRDGDAPSAQVGISRPPYREWTWKGLGHYIGGPALIRLPDGRFVAGTRLGNNRTSLCWLEPEAGRLKEFLRLPSGSGDTAYPGLVWHDDLLWISYYSDHEGKTSIYLAKVKFE